MKPWLKGGLILFASEIIFFAVLFFQKCDFTEMAGGGHCSWSFSNFIENIVHLLTDDIIVIVIAIGILLVGFLIGSFVGWGVGRLMSKE